jgi:hypothetical protein
MSAFRQEIKQAHYEDARGFRAGRFVPLAAGHARSVLVAGGDVPTPALVQQVTSIGGNGTTTEDADDFDRWPDELVAVGIDLDEPMVDATTSTTDASLTSTSTVDTASEDGHASKSREQSLSQNANRYCDESDDDDLWPLELLDFE